MNQNHVRAKELESILMKYGFDVSEKGGWRASFNHHKTHAKARGIESFLSFEDYIVLASKASLVSPKQIGSNNDKFQLGRYGDVGPYDIDNCRFITKEENRIECNINGGDERAKQKKAGRNKSNHTGCLSAANKLSFFYYIISPNDEIFIGKNLREFCESNPGLDKGNMSRLCSGKTKRYKGWRGKYISQSEYEILTGKE